MPWMNSPDHRANILNSSYSRIGSASVNIDGHALLGAAFRGLTGADRHSLPAALNARPRADCINRSDSAICTDFFRHRAGDFLPPYRSTLPLKVQPVQALAEQVSIF